MPAADLKSFEIALDQIARGDATPAEAATTIRKALLAEPALGSRVYDVLRDVTWRTLTSRSFSHEVQQWFDVFRHAAALAAKNSGGTAEKIRACADLLSQSVRFAELQPLEEVLNRKHTKPLLSAIASGGSATRNSALKRILGLAESNLSRVTGALLARGLIERSSSGKEASFSLTELGQQIAKKHNIASDHRPAAREWWFAAPYALAVWEPSGEPVGANVAFFRLTRSQEPYRLAPLTDWRREMAKMARDDRMPSGDTWRLRLDDATWLQFVEAIMPDGRCCLLGLDVSADMKGISDVEEAFKVAKEAEAKLRQERAYAENQLVAYRAANSHIRDEIVNAVARSNLHLQNTMRHWDDRALKGYLVPQELQEAAKNLGAMQLAVRNLMHPVELFERGREWGWIDPKQIVSEAVNTAKELDPRVNATFSFGKVERVRGAGALLRTALNYIVLIGMRHAAYDVHGAVRGSNFIATVRPKTSVVNVHEDSVDAVARLGLGYCQALVETHGGALEVEGFGTDEPPAITLSLPVEKRSLSRGGKAKASRQRRPIVPTA